MNPIILVILFFSFLSALSFSQLQSWIQKELRYGLYQRVEKMEEKSERWKEKAKIHQLKTKTPKSELKKERSSKPSGSLKKRSYSFQIDLERPPHNSRLNFYSLIHGSKEDPESLALKEITSRLLKNLYGHTDFYNEVPQLAARLFHAFEKKQEEMNTFTTPDELAGVNLEDPALQVAFYKMLKGADKGEGGYPSLLHYITYDVRGSKETKKINLMFCSQEVLNAVFEQTAIVNKLMIARQQLWSEILSQEEKTEEPDENGITRTIVKERLRSTFRSILESEGLRADAYESLFDFSLGKIGSVLMVHDPEQNTIWRQTL